MEAVQHIDVEADLLADLAGRNIGAVVAEDLARGEQHRRERLADLLDRDALVEQPRDQLSPFDAAPSGQPVQQPGRLHIEFVAHDTGGRRFAHGRAASIWALSDNSVASSDGRPTSWRESGRCSPSSAQGTEAAG